METVSYDVSVLKSAIIDTNLGRVQELLSQQFLSKDNENNQDLLTAAVESENAEITELLLKHGCTVATSTSEAPPLPLYHAVQSENLEMIKVLLAAGASVTDKDSQSKETPLQKAFELVLSNNDFKIIDLMLSAYNVENMNVENEDDIVYFFIACIRNKTSLVELFIEKGVSVNICLDHQLNQWNGSTALHFAVKYQSFEVIELLLENKANALSQDFNMQSPLHLAFLQLMNECGSNYARDKAEEIVDMILSAQKDDICNPTDIECGVSHFHIACMRNHISIVEYYLQSGVDVNTPVNSTDNKFFTWYQNTPLHFAAISCNKDIIKLLIDNGAEVDAINGHGLTPLWLLVDNQPKYSKVKNYIKFCLSKNRTQQNGGDDNENSLINLIINEFGYIECIKLLLEAGSNLNHKDEYGKPLLFEVYDSTVNNFTNKQDILGVHGTDDEISNICSEYFLITLEKTLNIFKEKGIDLECRDIHANTILHFITQSVTTNQVFDLARKATEIMLSSGLDLDVQNGIGEIPINIATINGSLEFVGLLLKFNVDPNSKNKMLQAPLDAAFSERNEDDVLRSEMIEFLTQNGANIDNRNAKGETVLFKAARSSCYLSSLKSILEASCNIDAQNNKGETALFVAVLKNNHEGTKLLLDYGASINVTDNNEVCLMEKLFLANIYSDYINKTYMTTLEILAIHIRKLKLTNHFVSHCNLVNCKRLKFAYTYEPHISLVKGLFDDMEDLDIDVTDKDRLLTTELHEEIKKMQAITIDSDTSLFDALFQNPGKMSKLFNSEYFQKSMNEKKLSCQFPHFGNLLTLKVKEALTKYACMEDAVKSLKCITDKNIPDSYLHEITLYLSSRDIKNLLCVNL